MANGSRSRTPQTEGGGTDNSLGMRTRLNIITIMLEERSPPLITRAKIESNFR